MNISQLNFFSIIADIISIIHLIIVGFIVLGELLIIIGNIFKFLWIRNLLFRIIHIILIIFITIESITGILCPLTIWEYKLRRLAGQSFDNNISFIARLIHKIIFYDIPQWIFTITYIIFGIIVILSFIFIPPNFKKNSNN